MIKEPSLKPLLSIVVPVYNVAAYLDECLDSIMNQSLDRKLYEVILVNDGSTDGSELKAERWAQRYSNINLIHRQNGGLSAARNTGINQASGKYLAFVDSDDVVPVYAYQEMLDILEETGSDFITGPAQRFSDNGRTWPFTRSLDLFTESRKKLTIKTEPKYIRDTTPWNKVYSRDFFMSSGIRFPEGRIYEDVATSPKFYLEAKSFDVYGSVAYYWRVNESGITQTLDPVKANDRLWAMRQILEYFANNKVGKAIVEQYYFTVIDYNMRWIFLDLWKYDPKSRKFIIEDCCKLIKNVDVSTIRRVPQPIQKWAFLAKKQQSQELLRILSSEQRSPNEALVVRGKHVVIIQKINRLYRISKRRIKRYIKRSLRLTKIAVIYLILRPVYLLFPVQKSTAVFSSYWGRDFLVSNGPPAICLELSKLRPDFTCVVFALPKSYEEIVMAVKDTAQNDANIKVVKNNSAAYYYYLWTAKYLFNDVNFTIGINGRFASKREGQVEIQTTHGVPLKRMGIDSQEAIKDKDRKAFLAKNKRYDYLCSTSPMVAKIFSSSHAISPKILETGLPQNDFIFKNTSNDVKEKMRQKYSLSSSKKLILYTPTFRYGRNVEFPYLMDFNRLKKELSNEYQLIIKPHPFNYTNLANPFFDYDAIVQEMLNKESFVRLFGNYKRKKSFAQKLHDNSQESVISKEEDETRQTIFADINELMAASDMLITDYSSAMFGYAHFKRPTILFTPDASFYEKSRGNYFNVSDIAPGAVTTSTEELISAIRLASTPEKWEMKYSKQQKKFKHDFLLWENGEAANKILHEIGIISK